MIHGVRDTSLLAYFELLSEPEQLGHMQQLVYNFILKHPLCCDKEIS